MISLYLQDQSYPLFQVFAMTSHERDGIIDHSPLDSMFSISFMLTSVLRITGHFREESANHRWPVDSPYKGSVVRKTVPSTWTKCTRPELPLPTILPGVSRNGLASLQWRHNERDCASNHRRLDRLLNVCSGADQRKHQSSASLAFVRGIHRPPSQRASNAENVSIWWRHRSWRMG